METPLQFHQLSNRDPATGQFTQLQSISTSQVPLPVIAPRPSAPDEILGPNASAGIARYGISGESYNSYSYPYNTRQYIGNELLPRMQQGFQPRAASQQDEQDAYIPIPIPIPEQTVANSLGSSYSYPTFPKLEPGESDSGIEMGHPWLSSQSSIPSNPSLIGLSSGHGRYGAGPTNSTVSRPSAADNSPHIIYPNSTNGISLDLWPKPPPGDYHDPWSSTNYPQPADARDPPGEVTTIASYNRRRGPLFEGDGKCLSLPFVELRISISAMGRNW